MTRRALAAVAVLALSLGPRCVTPRTELLVEVDTDLAWQTGRAIDRVRVTVRDDGADGPLRRVEELRVGPAAGAHTFPLSFGVLPRDGGESGNVHVDVTGCRGPCESGSFVSARALAAFVPRETRVLRLTLAARCRHVACGASLTCDPASGTCASARRDPASLPPVGAPDAATPRVERVPLLAAGLGQSCLVRADGALVCWGELLPGREPPTAGDVRAVPRVVSGPGSVTAVALGHAHACAVTSERTARCWGADESGQVGDGTTAPERPAAPVVDGSGAPWTDLAEVGVGWDASCARTVRGEVRCWGANGAGQLGDGTAAPRPRASIAVRLAAPAEQLSVGFNRACAVLETGAVWCWGRGVGPSPARVEGVPPAVEVRVGWRHACARSRDGRVHCWGDNAYGQLGRGHTRGSDVAGPVADLDGVASLSASGFHTCALRVDGGVRCWGRNDLGQLGDRTTAPRPSPVAVRAGDGELARVRAVAAGVDHTCALVEGAAVAVVCWGGDLRGETGSGRLLSTATARPLASGDAEAVEASPSTTCARREGVWACWGTRDPGEAPTPAGAPPEERPRVVEAPRRVAGLAVPYAEAALGAWHTCARGADGTVACWGDNGRAQLGTAAAHPTREPVPDLDDAVGLAAGASHTCARVAGDHLRCWGANESGQLGDGSLQDRAAPRAVDLDGVTSLAAGERFTCARTRDGAAWCWGGSERGALGVSSSRLLRAPTRIARLSDVAAVAAGADHACALRDDGAVACWGDNRAGQLGDGTAASRDEPRAVPGLRDAREVRAGGDTTCARLADETVRCWGRNDHGQVGDGSDVTRAAPTAVAGLRGARGIAVGEDFACALLADGGVVCWGGGESGQRGDGARDVARGPTRVVAADGRPLTGASAVTAGGSRACAVVAGELACWGAGDHGELGDGVWRPRPVAALVRSPDAGEAAVTDARGLALGARHGCVVRAGGRVACWGSNGDGRLGDGTRTDRPSPVYVVGDVAVEEVTAGLRHTCARDADGGVWCWGDNGAGQLLAGARGGSEVPVRVALPGAATCVRAGERFTCARLADGTAACWGDNASGQLGRGDAAPHADAALVRDARTGAPLRDVGSLAAGPRHACADLPGGAVWCWGDNASGQSRGGDGAPLLAASPVPGVELVRVPRRVTVGAGPALSCAGDPANVHTLCWGSNADGQIDPTAPRAALGPTALFGQEPSHQALTFGVGVGFLCVTSEAESTARCAGRNDFGQRGNGARGPLAVPLAVIDAPGVDVVAAGEAHACGYGRAGALRCWGRNDAGQLGVGSVDGHAFAAPPVGPTATPLVTGGALHQCALLADGTARCWGHNRLGQLGTGDLVERAAPTAVRDLAGAASLSAGVGHTCAARASDGAVRCWGRNDRLQLGELTGDPAGIYAARGVLGARRVSAGGDHTCAALSDGRVACWGDRGSDQLGDAARLMGPGLPVIVPGLARVVDVAAGGLHTCAVDDGGAVSCWGANGAGQVGDGGRSPRPTPARALDAARAPVRAVQVAASRDLRCAWRDDGSIGCALTGRDFSCARGAEGGVWCWGENDLGQLGDLGRAPRGLAAPVAGVTGARAITVGARHACAQSGGGWRCWGDNHDGALDDGAPAAGVAPTAVRLP